MSRSSRENRSSKAALSPRLPESCEAVGASQVEVSGNAVIETARYRCDPTQWIGATISIDGLSRFVSKLGRDDENITAFILLGREKVLAHRKLVGSFAMSEARPIPPLSGFTDPIIVRLWDPKLMDEPWVKPRPPLKAHILQLALPRCAQRRKGSARRSGPLGRMCRMRRSLRSSTG